VSADGINGNSHRYKSGSYYSWGKSEQWTSVERLRTVTRSVDTVSVLTNMTLHLLTRRCVSGTSTRARLAELDALKARLSTFPLSPASTPTPQDTAAFSPSRGETEWTDLLNWTEPQTPWMASSVSLGVPVPVDDTWPLQPAAMSTMSPEGIPAPALTPAAPRQPPRRAHSRPPLSSRSPLHLAAIEGNAACVRTLLRHGADINSVNVHGATPLHVCAEHGNSHGHVAVVRILVEHGAHIDARDNSDATPLQAAAANGNDQVLDALASLGADVNVA